MLFNSIQYLLFLPLAACAYYLTGNRFKWLTLVILSCVFYMYFIPEYILCLFFLILVDFYAAKKIAGTEAPKIRRLYLVVSIISNLGLLFYFKYLNFFFETLNPVIHLFSDFQFKPASIILPLGLSFHTFQSISYVIDVYQKKINPERHLGIYSCYVLFFPQMVAGPIERYSTLGHQLNNPVPFRLSYLRQALPILITGFFYKVVIADNCGEYVNAAYSGIDSQSSMGMLLAILLFTCQIYSDFFGYSLIAQGSALILGIRLIDNFSFPLFSKSVTEFWQKWHISLSGWVNNYLFTPLTISFRNYGKAGLILALLVSFSLMGLWHGASWNFVIYGALHGIALSFELLTRKWRKSMDRRLPASVFKVTGILLTVLFFSLSLVFFRAHSWGDALVVFTRLISSGEAAAFSAPSLFLTVNILFILSTEFFIRRNGNYLDGFNTYSGLRKALLLAYLLFAILTFGGVDNLPFIYFQF